MTCQVAIEISCNHLWVQDSLNKHSMCGDLAFVHTNDKTHLTNSVQSQDTLNLLFFGIKDLYWFFAFPYNIEYSLLATKREQKQKER